MKTETFNYVDGSTELKGVLAYDDSHQQPRPAVLIAHDWTGCNDFARNKAEALAKLGYIGFAIDMFGKGRLGKDNDEKKALITPFLEDRNYLIKRITAALTALKNNPLVDSNRIAAIGFCFGGLCVLDLARSGADVKGVVSFHGLLNKPEHIKRELIKAKVLILHGFDDPMVPPEQLIEFCKEMTGHKADWQADVYGNTMHAFSNPLANDPGFGTVYSAKADQRSWLAMQDFLKEIF